jgi:hypothetical protein
MKTNLIQVLMLFILMASTNLSYALTYNYRYQGNEISPMININGSLPQFMGGNAISIDILLTQPIISGSSNINPDSVLSVTAWDGTQLISTSSGASYSISMLTDPLTGLPQVGGIWTISLWQEISGGIHTISTNGAGWAGATAGLSPEGHDFASYTISDTSLNGNFAWNNTNPGIWTLSIMDDTAPAPEPCTFLLLGTGYGFVYFMRRKKNS